MKNIPFVPLPLERALRIARPFIGVSQRVIKLFPDLKTKLAQANIKINAREYLSLALFSGFFWFLITFCLLFPLNILKILPSILVTLFVPVSMFALAFLYIILYPSLIVTRRVRQLDKNLLFALKHLLIQVKSGVTLFDGMVSVSRGDYGLVSKEFGKCTKNISTGTPEVDAINDMAIKNPSLYFRRILWQLANSMKAGADIGDSLNALVENLSNEQRVEIRRYGSQLNPLALMYMMFTVIIPSLGITFLFIVSSFAGLSIPVDMFYILLFVLIVFQVLFIGLIKSRRPAFEV